MILPSLFASPLHCLQRAPAHTSSKACKRNTTRSGVEISRQQREPGLACEGGALPLQRKGGAVLASRCLTSIFRAMNPSFLSISGDRERVLTRSRIKKERPTPPAPVSLQRNIYEYNSRNKYINKSLNQKRLQTFFQYQLVIKPTVISLYINIRELIGIVLFREFQQFISRIDEDIRKDADQEQVTRNTEERVFRSKHLATFESEEHF